MTRKLKELTKGDEWLDNLAAFDAIKIGGSIGIPCFVMEDDRVVFDLDKVITDDKAEGGSCSIDGKVCRVRQKIGSF